MSIPMRELVDAATSPHLKSEDWSFIMDVVDAINNSPNGPQDASACIVERLQYAGERVQSYALTLLEACVSNCGPRFHAVIGKFKFLNELIKLVSTKYYTDTPEPIKRRILGMIQDWKNTLNQPKITEAYDMLKRQGHDFPLDAVSDSVPINDRNFLRKDMKRSDSFDENEKKQMLQALLQSKDPRDLAAANALIKEMVKADDLIDDEANEKLQRDLDVAENNIQLFREMLENWSPADGPLQKNELVQELYRFMLSMRPRLQRLIGDITEEEDADGMLPLSRQLRRALELYEDLVSGQVEPKERNRSEKASCFPHIFNAVTQGAMGISPKKDKDDDLLLLDLGDDPAPASGDQPQASSTTNTNDLLSLGLDFSSPAATAPYGHGVGGMMGYSPAYAPPRTQNQPIPRPQENLLGDMASLNLGVRAASPVAAGSPSGTRQLSVSPSGASGMSITPETFRPRPEPPVTAFDKDGIRILIHTAANPPSPDVTALMLTYMNQNAVVIPQFEFLAAVPKTMKIKMYVPNATSLPAFDVLQPKLVHQILVVQNPTKAPLKLRYRFTYALNGQPRTEQGDVAGFP